ncbi:MAG: nitronate monooxygenase [Bdellovibrionota bacterium]
MKAPVIIQGGMGAGVSDWRLARTVSCLGHLGVVSGTAVNTLLLRRLQDGDPNGDSRRALSHFPDQKVAQEIIDLYFKEGGRAPGQAYKLSPLSNLSSSLRFQQLSVAGAFVECWLAKEGHDNPVGINLLEKLQLANLPAIYGAMLASVDYVLMGAGIPREIPGVLDLFSEQKAASIKVHAVGATTTVHQDITSSFDPALVLPDLVKAPLKRPLFLAIVSSATLATHLMKKSTGKVDGFIVEGPLAGGHNAPPRGPMKLTESGEPLYGIKDVPDLVAIKDLGLPFWMAGSFATPEKLREARDAGAAGIQVGTAFAFCEESGMSESIKRAAIRKWGLPDSNSPDRVFTDPLASPTDFPFKVAPMTGSLSDEDVYKARPRICDLGYLRTLAVGPSGDFVHRCPSEPIADYLKKGGKLEETVGRKCLCNALMTNIDMGQSQKNGYNELALVTAGDDLIMLRRFLCGGKTSYSARDVIEHLLQLPKERIVSAPATL